VFDERRINQVLRGVFTIEKERVGEYDG